MAYPCDDKSVEEPAAVGVDGPTLIGHVMKLPEKYRVTIHLYYYEGYSVKEIADITGSSASAVTTRLMRARERLKEMLLKEDKQ